MASPARSVRSNRSAPRAPVVPILVYPDVEAAIAFLIGAFGVTERLRAHGPDGRVTHAQLAIGDGDLIVGRAGGPFRTTTGGGASHIVHVTVRDARAHFARAQSFGARIVRPPSDMPFGERQYTVEDPGGHWWTFSQHIADIAPESWGAIVASGDRRAVKRPRRAAGPRSRS